MSQAFFSSGGRDAEKRTGKEAEILRRKSAGKPVGAGFLNDFGRQKRGLSGGRAFGLFLENLKVYGAGAYLRSESSAVFFAERPARLFAEKQGLFVIRATGAGASLVNAKDFKPKVFA